MSVLTVEGTYKDGKVELVEAPIGVDEADVLVTFLPKTRDAVAERRETLRQRFLARLERGVDFGSEPLPAREELYAERLDRYR